MAQRRDAHHLPCRHAAKRRHAPTIHPNLTGAHQAQQQALGQRAKGGAHERKELAAVVLRRHFQVAHALMMLWFLL
jgi:hypothetical protein